MPVSDFPEAMADSPLTRVRRRITAAALAAGRAEREISLIAVSKGQPIDAITALAVQGQQRFGENYVQEALPKIAALRTLSLSWHFIGRLQSNKTREVATHFAWVHSLDRLKLAERLNEQRPAELPPLACCIEVHLGSEASKGGVEPGELAELVQAVRELPRLELKGLMGMPPLTEDFTAQRAAFRRLHDLLQPYADTLNELSMGTSGDFEAAIAEGATLVRIGTAVFGPRKRAL